MATLNQLVQDDPDHSVRLILTLQNFINTRGGLYQDYSILLFDKAEIVYYRKMNKQMFFTRLIMFLSVLNFLANEIKF